MLEWLVVGGDQVIVDAVRSIIMYNIFARSTPHILYAVVGQQRETSWG